MLNNSWLLLVLHSVQWGSVWERISVILLPWESAEKSYSRDTADEKEGKNRLNSNEATFLQPGAMRESKWGVASPHKDLVQLFKV